MATIITVDQVEAGERLDKFLVRHLPGVSRSRIQKLIAADAVVVNHQPVTAHHVVKANDAVAVETENVAVRQQPIARPPPSPSILFENDSILVINKPAGLVVHPGAGVHGPTLVDWLVKHAPSITTVGDDPQTRPGIVHRLDRDVSGVMVVAKTQPAFERLKQQFKERTVEKEYLTLVHGIPKNPAGTIDFRIDRSKRMHGRMAARPLLPVPAFAGKAGTEEGMAGGQGRREGREAHTHYTVERVVKNNALLRVTIATGRTHQIRVHLKALGHPIVGDAVYTTKPHRKNKKEITLKRPFLHAERLSFTDLSGKKCEFTAPLSEDLRRFIDS